MDVDRCRLHKRGLRNTVGYVERIRRGNYIHGPGQRARTGSCDANGQVRRGREQDRCRDDHNYSSAAYRHFGKSRDCFGADRQNAERYCDGAKRYSKQGSDVDVDRRRLHGSNLRNAFGYVECIRRGNYLHGPSGGARTGDRDANGQVRRGREQDCCRDDHGHTSSACGRCGQSHGCVGTDRQNPERYRDGAKRYSKQGSDVDVDRRRLHGSNLRNAFGYFECIRRSHYVHGPSGGARTGSCDANS